MNDIMTISNCTYSVKGKAILRCINWRIKSGRFAGIVGPNGAGKTTLLKLLTGELAADAGVVTLEQRPLNYHSPSELAARRAVVSQFHDTHFPFSGNEVIDMCFDALPIQDFARSEQHKHFAVEQMGVAALMPRRFDRLSGGEQQRVLCARALTQLATANEQLAGKILFLDEPTSNMDIRHQLLFFKLLKSLCQKGLAVVAVLHDLDHIYQYADEVILLSKGNIVAEGHPSQTLNHDNIDHLFGVSSTVVKLDQGTQRLLIHS